MKYLIIGAIAVTGIYLLFNYGAGQLNKKWDDSFIDREWEKEFEEQEWD